jgi:hypothetical protein
MPRVTAENLFRDYFLPLYPEEARRDLARARATDVNPGRNPSVVAPLGDAATVFVAMARSLFEADLGLDYGDTSVHRLSAAVTRARRDAWASRGAPGTPESELFNVVVHGAAYVGACVVRAHEGEWSARQPLWESQVRLRSAAGEALLAPFHWWLKSLADDVLDEEAAAGAARLADRYRAHVEAPRASPDALPVFVRTTRSLPRLTKVRYDALHKYLRAHLPELRDLGADFPSPERFAELGFKWMEAHVLGGGRLVLLAGHGSEGVHLYWLVRAGLQ